MRSSTFASECASYATRSSGTTRPHLESARVGRRLHTTTMAVGALCLACAMSRCLAGVSTAAVSGLSSTEDQLRARSSYRVTTVVRLYDRGSYLHVSLLERSFSGAPQSYFLCESQRHSTQHTVNTIRTGPPRSCTPGHDRGHVTGPHGHARPWARPCSRQGAKRSDRV